MVEGIHIMASYDYLCKLVILGDHGIGRTNLGKYLDQIGSMNRQASYKDQITDIDKNIDDYRVLRENSNSFLKKYSYSLRIKQEIKKKEHYLKIFELQFDPQESTRLTLGVSYHKIIVEIRRNRVKLQIWILGNQERFRSIRKMYVRGSSGAILLYDITNASSLNRISEWREMIAELCGEIPIVLIGNKLDLEEQRTVSKERGIELQEKNNLSSFMEISTETGENVEKMFELIGHLILNIDLNY